MQAGFDCQKLSASKLQQKPSNTSLPVATAPDAPVLVLKNYKPPKPEQESTVSDKEVDDWFSGGFFAAIQERKKAKLKKLVDNWDEPTK
jgi:hypothetical protein